MTQKELLKNYLLVGNYKHTNPPSSLTDVKISDVAFLRKMDTGYYIYYLNNGNSIFIPWEWINLFSAFSAHSGYQSRHISVTDESDNIDKVIYYFTILTTCIDCGNIEKAVQVLSKIFEIGVSDFRNWIKERDEDLNLENIIFSSINNEIIL